jgi:CRP/FNR family transcriptional regulator, cyclic AMP receptor protein
MESTSSNLLRLQQALQTNKWFADCDEKMQSTLLKIAKEQKLNSGQVLFRRGQVPEGFYCVLSGCAQLYLQDGGKEHLTVHALPYEWIGVSSLLDSSPTTTCIARGGLTVACVDRIKLLSWLDINPCYWRDIAKLLGYRYRASMALVRAVSDLSLDQRILYRLKFIACGYGLRGFSLNRIDISQQEVASMLGASRTSVTAALSKLVDQDLVKIGYGSIYLLDKT